MIARIIAFVSALVLGSLLAACAQAPRGPAASTVPPADKPLAVTPALVEPKPAAAADYRLGPGDVVKISVYNNPDLSIETELSQKGSISFPLVGEVPLGGLTRAAAEQAIAQRLDSGGFVPKPHVNLLVTLYRSQQISVLGEVNKPGKYAISQAVGVTDVLAMAGGITAKGSQLITVTRKTQDGRPEQRQIDVSKLLAGAGDAGDLRLGNDDIIFVPPAAVFYIYGEVRQPGAYPLASDMTVSQALSIGGGLTVRGTQRGIRVDRKAEDGRVNTLTAQLNDRLQANDVVKVPESLF
ncbi:MAG TPA: polysaccharide export protein EpsE [Burkholderiales bacterium]|jgi:polysaccharide export outer membrane protein|nr:polysaccharide export protein EpsE [Burkholderiales bacterium]